MKLSKKITKTIGVVAIFGMLTAPGMVIAGNGHGPADGAGNGGENGDNGHGPGGNGTGNGPGDCLGSVELTVDTSLLLARGGNGNGGNGNGPGDGSGNGHGPGDGTRTGDALQDGTGKGPGDCLGSVEFTVDTSLLLAGQNGNRSGDQHGTPNRDRTRDDSCLNA